MNYDEMIFLFWRIVSRYDGEADPQPTLRDGRWVITADFWERLDQDDRLPLTEEFEKAGFSSIKIEDWQDGSSVLFAWHPAIENE